MTENHTTSELMEAVKHRLREVMDGRRQIWWADQLGVSQGVLSSRYYRGIFPKFFETLLEIIKISKVSPNWLLLGIGPKYWTGDEDVIINKNQDQKRQHQIEILQLEEENQKLKEQCQALARQISVSAVQSMLQTAADAESDGVFDDNLLKILSVYGYIHDIAIKTIALYFKKEISHEKFIRLVEHIGEAMDYKTAETSAKLKALDPFFK